MTNNHKFWCRILVISGILMILINSCKKDDNIIPSGDTTVKDWDNNVYHIVKIGKQTWMVENLKTRHYSDGANITNITDPAGWDYTNITPAYCSYRNTNNVDTINTYGLLYNWYAVNTGNLCPAGWRIPTDDDWDYLISYLGGEAIAGGKLKESGTKHWSDPNTGADNSSGFMALPGGNRTSGDYTMGFKGYWWSATENNILLAGSCSILFSYSTAIRETGLKSFGYSVRCIKIDTGK
jgi:uncharacterized protein (TIGR02145 family)